MSSPFNWLHEGPECVTTQISLSSKKTGITQDIKGSAIFEVEESQLAYAPQSNMIPHYGALEIEHISKYSQENFQKNGFLY